MRLLLGIPTAGTPAAPFVDSLTRLAMPERATAFDRFIAQGNFVPAQRELIVDRALSLAADVLIMCDDDMVLPADALTALCAVLDDQPRCGLAGALYYSRDGLRPMAVDQWDPEDTTGAFIPAFDDRTPVKVDGVGFGCVAIRTDALRALQPPYFPAHVYVEKSTARVRVCNEDYLFCAQLRAAGYDVMLHPGVRAGHFDRATSTVAPSLWESVDATNHPRMVVSENGVPRLVPADASIARGKERHLRASVEYLVVE